MKKLFAMLLVGALVSLGCNNKTGTDHKGTEVKKTTEASGAGAGMHDTSASRTGMHDTSASRTSTHTSATPTPRSGSTQAKTTTQINGKTTSKVATTAKSGS